MKNSRSTRIQNLVLNNIDTTTMIEENLKLLNFEGNSVIGNIVFKNSNLSKMQYRGTTGPVNVTFDNTILPTDMLDSSVNTLILKNAILPEELKTASLKSMVNRIPYINNSIKIYNLQNRFFDQWTEEEINQLKPSKYSPEKYVGPKDIWDNLKHLYRDEGTKTHFTNEDLTDTPLEDINFSSIQKPQATSLALLGNSKAHG